MNRLMGLMLVGAMGSTAAHAEKPPPVSPPLITADQLSRDAAIIIGNEAYEALPQVIYASRDARAVTEWLQKTRGVSRYRTTILEDATRAEIEKSVRKTARKVKRRGTLWIYYAGHGTASNDEGKRGLLGVEANPVDPASSAVLLEDIVAQARSARRAWRIVVIVDASFGNVGRDGLELVPGREAPEIGDAPDFGSGVVVWLADTGTEAAAAYPNAQHGLFTYLVLGAARGWADGALYDPPDGQVSLLEAQTYVDQAAQRLGRLNQPSVDLRPEENKWPLVQGDNLESGPDAATARRLSLEDRQARFDEQEELLKAEAAAFWGETMQAVQAGGPMGRDALEGFITEYERASVSVEWAVALPELEKAREMLISYDDSVQQTVSMAASDIIASCDDLLALEAPAMGGSFSVGQVNCLENRLRTERLQTTRSKISRLLLVNAEMAGDAGAWEELMARHLEEIDRSDPDLCFRYAIHLYKSDIESQEESLRWAGYALENKQNWEGEEFVKKVSSLHKLRAEASAKLWQDAAQQYASNPSGETDDIARDYRGMAMDYAREWLDYVRAAGLSEKRAYDMCVSAAGTDNFCKER